MVLHYKGAKMDRVRVNAKYRFNPCGWDTVVPCQGMTAKAGDVVKVINLPMAPKANTMGQCYIEDMAGEFAGMVSVHSLDKL